MIKWWSTVSQDVYFVAGTRNPEISDQDMFEEVLMKNTLELSGRQIFREVRNTLVLLEDKANYKSIDFRDVLSDVNPRSTREYHCLPDIAKRYFGEQSLLQSVKWTVRRDIL